MNAHLKTLVMNEEEYQSMEVAGISTVVRYRRLSGLLFLRVKTRRLSKLKTVISGVVTVLDGFTHKENGRFVHKVAKIRDSDQSDSKVIKKK